jgi:hypothetical protein
MDISKVAQSIVSVAAALETVDNATNTSKSLKITFDFIPFVHKFKTFGTTAG